MTYENSADLGKQRQDQALSLVIRCGIGNLGIRNSANDWSPSSTDQNSKGGTILDYITWDKPFQVCSFAWFDDSMSKPQIRELKQLRRLQKNNMFNDQNNSSARASRFLVHFFDVHCTTTTSNLLISRFMEDVDMPRRNFLHLF